MAFGLEDPPIGIVCRRCKQRMATLWWSDWGTAMALAHGDYEARCERCCVEEQLRHAKELAESIPKLEARLKELGDGR
jgi:hypothetical protein